MRFHGIPMRYLELWDGDDDCYNKFEAIEDILNRDNVAEFDEFVLGKGYVDPDKYDILLNVCIKQRAVACTLHLLRGYLPDDPPDVTHQLFDGVPALFLLVENMWDTDVYHLLLHHYGALNHANLYVRGFLPLHKLLHNLVEHDHHLCHWSLDNSLTKLILHLFLQPLVIAKLDCARLVAAATNSVNDVALGFIQRGEIIQLACLLLVAREKAMAPFSSGIFAGETIKQHTSLEWVARHAHRGQCGRATICAAGLLDIFEKAGDALANYHQCMPDNAVEVSFQVTQIMHDAGFKLTSTDFDLEEITSDIQAEVLRCIQERLGSTAFRGTFKSFEMSKKYTASLPRIIDGGLSSVNCKAYEAAQVAKLKQRRSERYKYQASNNVEMPKASWGYFLPNLVIKLKQRVKLSSFIY